MREILEIKRENVREFVITLFELTFTSVLIWMNDCSTLYFNWPKNPLFWTIHGLRNIYSTKF